MSLRGWISVHDLFDFALLDEALQLWAEGCHRRRFLKLTPPLLGVGAHDAAAQGDCALGSLPGLDGRMTTTKLLIDINNQ